MVPPTVRSLIPEGQATTNLITYSQETAATNAADAVSEGAAKPESSLTFTKASDAIRKIATWVPASRETFDDAPFFRSYLDARLRSFVDAETDNQILNGSGVDPDILGILNRAGLTPPHAQAAGENAFDAIAFQYGAIASSQYVLPDGVVLNPADWIRFLTTRTTTGEYLSGSPFEPFLAPRLWGMRVAQSPFLAPGQALVGSFLIGALLVLNGGMRIEVSTQHQDFFVRNLVAVLCEQRVALCILRPAAFGLATALTFTPPAP
jgi:HK97 family phage major capsid protein